MVHNAPVTEQRNLDLSAAIARREAGDTDGAREALLVLAERFPGDVEIAYQAASIHDLLGLEAQAVPFYRTALDVPGLAEADRHGAFVGLGSTYRVLGRYRDSIATFRRGLAEFPGDATLRTFLAMSLYNTGEAEQAVGMLLKVLAETSGDEQVRGYRRAIEYYADNLDEVV